MDAGRNIPEGSRAWAIAWTLGFTELISWGVLYYAFTVLLVPMQEELGWSVGAITGAYSLSMLVSGLAAPALGRWLDDHGPRGVMTCGSILGTLLVLAWSRVDTLPGFYLIWIGIGLASAATLYEPAFTTLAQWFRRGRSRAMLIVTILGGFASTVFLPLTGWLVDRYDWRSALVILAIILAAGTVIPHAAVLLPGPAHAGSPATTGPEIGPHPRFKDLLREPVFARMSIAFFLQTTTSIAVAVHIIAFLVERGQDATFAAWAAGLIGAAQVAARIFTTIFERHFSIISLTAMMFAFQVVAIVMLVTWHHATGVIVAVIFLGMGRGAITLLRPSLVMEFYDVSRFGSINGMQALILTIGRAIAPVMTGVAAGASGSYIPIFWVFAVISLISAWVILPLREASSVQQANAEGLGDRGRA
jgi:MFS family permease